MSIIKNPIVLALIAGGLVYIITAYFFGDFDKKKKDEQKNKKNKKNDNSREIIIISTVVATIITWYIASKYFDYEKNDNNENLILDIDKYNNNENIDVEELTKSYNLLGTGLNIPKNELDIPKVLINYK